MSPYKINLVPEKVQGLAITNYYNSLKEVTFGFTQPEYHDGYVYELYTYKKKKVSSGNLSSISYNTLKNIKNQFYKLRVRAYVQLITRTTMEPGLIIQFLHYSQRLDLRSQVRS